MTFLEHGQHFDRADLALVEQDVAVLVDNFWRSVGDEVRRDVALVELHTRNSSSIPKVLGLDGDNAVLADLVDGVGENLTNRSVGGRNCRDLGDLPLSSISIARDDCFDASRNSKP
ncbi:MAG: hypothetical protein R2706_14105 [Acidimicrobiales bacterium]